MEEDKPTETNVAQPPVNGTNNGANGHAKSNGNGATALPSSPVIGDASTPLEASRRLLLRLIEGEPEHDKRMLYDLRSILMDYRGDSEVTLEIATSGQIVEMEWPAVRVLAGDELIDRLNNEVLGSSGEAHLVPETAR